LLRYDLERVKYYIHYRYIDRSALIYVIRRWTYGNDYFQSYGLLNNSMQ